MTKHVQISWCPQSRVSELRAFIHAHWRQDHVLARDEQFLRWQFLHADDPENLFVVLADVDGELAGMLGLIPAAFSDRGRRVCGVMLANWMVRKDLRKKTFLGPQLLRWVLAQKYGFTGTLGANDDALRVFRSMRFSLWHRIPRWARTYSADALANLLEEGGDLYPDAARAAWLATAELPSPSEPPGQVRLTPWNDETAAAWERAWCDRFASQMCGTWRDTTYLRWRYVDHPNLTYVIRFAQSSQSGEILGLLVYRLTEVCGRSERVLRIVEFLGDETGALALAAEVNRVGVQHQVAIADFYCTAGRFAQCLGRVGFVREEDQAVHLPALFQPLDFRRAALTGAFRIHPEIASDSPSYFQTADLYFTRSDGDQDRPN